MERWTTLLEQWEKALAEEKEVLVLMDANIDFLKWTKDNLSANDSTARLRPLIDLLFTKIFPHGVSQLVTGATRTWPGQQDSGLDHVYSNKPGKLSEVNAVFTGGSDHKLLKVTRFSKSFQPSARYVRKRSYKDFSEQVFLNRVREISWFNLYMCEDTNTAVKILTDELTTILDELAPVRTIQLRSRYAPWLTKETKVLQKERDKAQQAASLSGSQEDWRLYKNLRNSTNSTMRKEKKKWEQKRLNNLENSPTTLWKNIKTWLNWKTSGPPTQLFHEGRTVRAPGELADTMNHFFVDKVARLRAGIPANDDDPLKTIKEVMRDRQCNFTMRSVTPDEVQKIIKSLKHSKSTGLDYIDTSVIKLAANELLPSITHIVNLSIRDQCFPQTWKRSKVVPLLKKDDRFNPKNYRPVALLSIISKILERSVYLQLFEYLDSSSLLHPNHHGSRRAHSTCTALIQMYDTWVHAAEEGELAGVMMVDVSAAFDMVDHGLLLQKLELLGLDEHAVRWFESYLSNRSQTVCVDGSLYSFFNVECGVPQGSVLGPLLYVLFTNDLPDVIHSHEGPLSFKDPNMQCSSCGGLVNFVDDATYTYACKDPAELSEKLTSQYENISSYMASNKLVINADKTHLLVLGTENLQSTEGDKRFIYKQVITILNQHKVIFTITLNGKNIYIPTRSQLLAKLQVK